MKNKLKFALMALLFSVNFIQAMNVTKKLTDEEILQEAKNITGWIAFFEQFACESDSPFLKQDIKDLEQEKIELLKKLATEDDSVIKLNNIA